MIIRVMGKDGANLFLETQSDLEPILVENVRVGQVKFLGKQTDLRLDEIIPPSYEIEESLKNDHPVWAYSRFPFDINSFKTYSEAFVIMNFQANENIKKMYRIVER